ncbi:uncharacterized protein LOC115229658 [Octopus sinensis]|uniref:Uncharacterized protein LOC115229658 n=1 Tax=Octopus sinensis TaxID=2607531 RepID=A0A6P7TU72_9MOLL|nr:uncharacterized protein LOC115229658 [Octopus sinensis]
MAYRQEDEINFGDTARRGTLFRTFRPKITPFWPFLFHDPTVSWIGEDDISLRESLEFEPQKQKWSKKWRLVLVGIILLLLALAAGLITTIILLTKSDTVDPVKRTMNVDLYFNETYKKEYADPENKLTIEKRREITEKIDNAIKKNSVLNLLYTGSSVTELRKGSILAKMQLEFESKIQEIREIQKVASADVVSQSLKKIPTLLVEKSCILWEGKDNSSRETRTTTTRPTKATALGTTRVKDTKTSVTSLVNVEMHLNEEYKAIYSDLNNAETQTKVAEISAKVDESMENSELADTYLGNNVTQLRNGSLIADLIMEFKRADPQVEIVRETMNNITGVIGEKTKVNFENTVEQTTTGTTEELTTTATTEEPTTKVTIEEPTTTAKEPITQQKAKAKEQITNNNTKAKEPITHQG